MSGPYAVFELPPSQYHVVAPLFDDVWIDRALIDAVIEGTEAARVFTDDGLRPETVLMCCERGDYVIMGSSKQGPVRRFIMDMPSEAGIFNKEHFAFFLPQIAWGDALTEDFGGEIPIFPTRSFKYLRRSIAPVEQWQEPRNQNEAHVRRIDSSLLVQIDQEALRTGKAFTVRGEEGGEITQKELADIDRDSFGFCTVVGDEIVSVASAFTLSSKYASLSIDTTLPYRKQGLATLACVAVIEECLGRNLTPLWNCLASNEASAKTALRLGMEEGPAQRESQWRPAWKQIKPSSGRWKRDKSTADMPSGIAVWCRNQ